MKLFDKIIWNKLPSDIASKCVSTKKLPYPSSSDKKRSKGRRPIQVQSPRILPEMTDKENTTTVRRAIYNLLQANHAEDSLFSGHFGIALGTHKNERDENQDRAVVVRYISRDTQRSFAMLAVCDGVGGLQDGGKCADIALAFVIAEMILGPAGSATDRIHRALGNTNQFILDLYQERGGTTFAGLVCADNQILAVNVGDSRIYEQRREGDLRLLSVEDRVGERMRQAGFDIEDIEPLFADHLTQYIGMSGTMKPHITRCEEVDEQSLFILTSDGAHSTTAVKLPALIEEEKTPENICSGLLDLASKSGEKDNSTAICMRGSLRELITPQVQKELTEIAEFWTPWRNAALVVLPSRISNDIIGMKMISEQPTYQVSHLKEKGRPAKRTQIKPEIERLIIEQLPFPNEPSP